MFWRRTATQDCIWELSTERTDADACCILIDHVFPDNLRALGPEIPNADFLATCDVIVFAIPTQSMR